MLAVNGLSVEEPPPEHRLLNPLLRLDTGVTEPCAVVVETKTSVFG